MSIITKEQELSDYIKSWINIRYDDWKFICDCVYRDRQYEIYKLKNGPNLMDLFISFISYLEEYFIFGEDEKLIPSRFSSVSQFLQSIDNQNCYLDSQYHFIENNLNGDDTSFIIIDLIKMLRDFKAMKERCWSVYHNDILTPSPYQQALFFLQKGELNSFIDVLKSLISDIPYNIHKEKINEGYFHTLFHVITSVIGFHPISEKTTYNGRIDTRIETPNTIYIFEFKYSDTEDDVSHIALKQIIENKYDQPEHTNLKPVIGVGISYSKTLRNINGVKNNLLFNPPSII